MKILIYETTDSAYMAARLLSEKHDVTVLAEMEQLPERFAALDIHFVNGSAADVKALEHANAAAADLFIACSSLGERNIVACWTVKRIADVETICFVHRLELYQNLHFTGDSRYRSAYDIDTVIWPEHLLTQDIFRIVSVPEAIDVEFFADGRVKLFEYRVKEDTEIKDKRIMDCALPGNILIVGITRDNELFIPNGRTVIEVDDKVIFMGTGPALDLLTARLFKYRRKLKKTIIIGGGNVGYLLAEQLEKTGLKVTVIEHDRRRCVFLADNLKESLVLEGDGTDLELLENAGVGDADATICVTDNDEKNLLCSLLVKQISSCRVITRVNNSQTAPLFDRVGVDVVVSPRDAALKDLLNHVQAREVDILALIERGQGAVVRLTVPLDFQEKKVADLQFNVRAIIGMVQRKRQIIIPDGNTVIKENDLLNIFTLPADVEAIKKLFAA